MDTMDCKHIHCFGPCMIAEWGLEAWEGEILARWNEVNLYTLTRGINRFKGLALALAEVNGKYRKIEDIDDLTAWAEGSKELSNEALKRAIAENPKSRVLQKALSWSNAVNEKITALPEEQKIPFAGVKEALAYAHERADVAIVSSANLGAVLEEWEKHGLLAYVDIVLAQNAGSKAFCIGELLKKGYDKEKTLMCGDALGDLQAAEKNGVYYYPVLVRREKESWEEFIRTACDKLIEGGYGGDYQEKKKAEFMKNLGA
ncbi:MAG: HAD hydrolase-like protein [Clostridia bacterium]|nr:HAD hydrolase-like protein [Clostridia bacterium]